MKITESYQILEKIYDLDTLCLLNGVQAEIMIIGGAGLTLFFDTHSLSFRPTDDIDVMVLKSSNIEDLSKCLAKSGIHVVRAVVELPPLEDFQSEGSKFQIEAGFSNIKVFVPTAELFACTKLFSKRQKDLTDLINSSLLEFCDIEVLREHVEEYKPYMLNPDDRNYNVHQLDKILKTKNLTLT